MTFQASARVRMLMGGGGALVIGVCLEVYGLDS